MVKILWDLVYIHIEWQCAIHVANGANLTKWDKAFVVITDLVFYITWGCSFLPSYSVKRAFGYIGVSLLADISELNLPTSCVIRFPNGKDDLMNFEVSIQPDDGYYMYGAS